MKRRTGGSLILALAILLTLRYCSLLPFSFSFSSSVIAASPPPSTPFRLTTRRARLLPSLPGFEDLFPSPPSPNSNATRPLFRLVDASDFTQVWPHMGQLLLRSDALPATSDGVREAAVAWRELLSSLAEEENDAKVPPFGIPAAAELKSSVARCPFSATGNGSSVEIQCGFVEDSAITVVGTPVGLSGNGSRFWIELVGSRFPDDDGKAAELPPIVLRCNVSVAEDGGPFLAQNSWTPDEGWGEWEQCPSHGSVAAASNSILKVKRDLMRIANSTDTVDGLSQCNEQSSQNLITGKANGSRPNGEKNAEQSKRSFPLTLGSPFVEGYPFTATLWAGLEGFHMTVNGRHEASFAYREKLDPWSVSEVRVGGDIDLISLLVNGLPISEDLDLVGDLAILKAPPLSKKRLLMLVGVSSSATNFQRRMALRRSWMQYDSVRSGLVTVRFLIGLHKSKQVNLELWREAQRYGDIQLVPFVDYYSLITLKTIATCILGTKIFPAKYIMKIDDDAFVRIDEVLSSLKNNASRGLLYGLISFESSPHRDEDSKWFISEKEWPHDTYPPWAHGPGYIISSDISEFIVLGHQERYLQLFKLEDVAMGIWIQEYKNLGHEVNYVSDERFCNTGCESNYVLAHYQGPRLLLCLWEKLQKEHKGVCCE